jgi:hypothetical protein
MLRKSPDTDFLFGTKEATTSKGVEDFTFDRELFHYIVASQEEARGPIFKC